jgi:CRP-like cAMP-binding protein
MTSPDPFDYRRQNRLLALLPEAEYQRLNAHLTLVVLNLKQTLYAPYQPIEYVYFPLNGVTSIVATMENGQIAEVGTVGNEGMVGLPVFLGARSAPVQAFLQVPGEALRLGTAEFQEEVRKGGALVQILHRYTQALFTQIAQSTACNRLHSIEQRCARWLLMTHDRVGMAEEFPLTHEFLGQMLGVRRATVSEVAGALQRKGLITYSRGKIRVVDRQGLEEAACECYAIVQNEFNRLLT